MKSQNMEIAKENMLMTSELVKVIKLLEENGIEAISFKGPILSKQAYGDVTLRQYVDLDILVQKEQISKTVRLLQQNYYNTNENLNFLDNEMFYKIGKDIKFINKKNNIVIELHWELFEEKILSREYNIFSNYTIFELLSNKIQILNNELNFLYLCIHGAKHGWERIEWLVDLDRLSKNYKIDIVMLQNYAKMTNSIKILYSSIYLISYLFNNKIFENILKQEITNKVINLSNEFIYEWSEDKLYQKKIIRINTKQLRIILKIQDGFYMRIKIFWKLFFELKLSDILYINLPKKLYYLYYFIRPIRLFSDFLKGLYK
jgi:hypothetical protein